MHVNKPLDLPLLAQQLTAAGVAFDGLGTYPSGNGDEAELMTYADGQPVELPPEAAPVVAAHDASAPQRTAAFESSEDAERLAIVNERAQTDPAFAALADLTLGKQGVTT